MEGDDQEGCKESFGCQALENDIEWKALIEETMVQTRAEEPNQAEYVLIYIQ